MKHLMTSLFCLLIAVILVTKFEGEGTAAQSSELQADFGYKVSDSDLKVIAMQSDVTALIEMQMYCESAGQGAVDSPVAVALFDLALSGRTSRGYLCTGRGGDART